MYIKILSYGQLAQRFYQQLRYIHALIKPQVTVNIPAITRASVLQNSDGHISDG
jgi:hypothetical protein